MFYIGGLEASKPGIEITSLQGGGRLSQAQTLSQLESFGCTSLFKEIDIDIVDVSALQKLRPLSDHRSEQHYCTPRVRSFLLTNLNIHSQEAGALRQ